MDFSIRCLLVIGSQLEAHSDFVASTYRYSQVRVLVISFCSVGLRGHQFCCRLVRYEDEVTSRL